MTMKPTVLPTKPQPEVAEYATTHERDAKQHLRAIRGELVRSAKNPAHRGLRLVQRVHASVATGINLGHFRSNPCELNHYHRVRGTGSLGGHFHPSQASGCSSAPPPGGFPPWGIQRIEIPRDVHWLGTPIQTIVDTPTALDTVCRRMLR